MSLRQSCKKPVASESSTAYAAVHPATIAKGKGRRMDWDDYLRDQAANYRKIAEGTEDPLVKQEHFELAAVCEEVANSIGDRLPGG
jgi:hypothetical protein